LRGGGIVLVSSLMTSSVFMYFISYIVITYVPLRNHYTMFIYII